MSSWIDRSGTVTSGGTAQTVSVATSLRMGFMIQNLSSGDLWLDFGATAAATQPAMKITSGSLYETPPNACPKGHISVYGATTSQAFSAKEW
jgi:hypothetical protein